MSETTVRPQNVLREILEHKRNEVKSRREGASLEAVQSKVSPTTRSLVEALRAPETGFVLECKRRSPSAGTLREPYDPVSLAAAYAPFASAISVLVDERFFGGSFEDLRTVRSRVDQPVLLKDFIVDPYQVYEARMYGADAVLLLLSVLDDERLRDCLAACQALGMDALCETVNADEIDRAVAAGASLIGINHRDLRTLEIDRSRVLRLASRVPSRIPLIAESAITCRRDVLSLRDQVDGFLIGGSLMREPGETLHRKLRSLIFGKTKICGLSRPEDARQAFAAGATHLGVVLAPSPRRVDPDRAAAIFASAPAATRVGVFVNEDHREILSAVGKLSLDIVQLHGDECADEIAALRAKLPPAVGIWKACAGKQRSDPLGPIDARLWDAPVGSDDVRGGTGVAWDWSEVVQTDTPQIENWLAGGIRATNAGQAVRLGFDGLDVSSGVESAPGVKDARQLARLFSVLRGRSRRNRS